MLSVEEASSRILTHFSALPAETVELALVLNRILAENIAADSNIPPFANSGMDGYAVHSSETLGSSSTTPTEYAVMMDIPAGRYPVNAVGPREAARIMTGAVLPAGADAVVPIEDTDAIWQNDEHPATVQVFREVRPGEYVRNVGEDIEVGQIVLRQGMRLGPAEIGVLASLGKFQVPVVGRPRVAIIATGNELVDAAHSPLPGQVRDSNSYVLAASVADCGGVVASMQIARDTVEDVRRCFQVALLGAPDLILSSAGVSVGAYDVVRTVIEELGSVQFWKVNVRPGKPLAFGQVGSAPFVGLPGNPVSAMVTFELFVRPALLKLAARPDDRLHIMAIAGDEFRSDGRRSYLRVTLSREGNEWVAHLTGTQSSGALMSMVRADGLMIVPEDMIRVHPGDRVQIRLLRPVPTN